MSNKTIEKSVLTECDLCGKKILVCESGYGSCDNCGWGKQILGDTSKIHYGNFVSFDKARRLWAEGKPIKADFKDFLECLNVYGELEFYYKLRHYGVMWTHEQDSKDLFIDFYEWNTELGFQSYKTIEEFAKKANINGRLLRNIWDDVENIGPAS